MLPSLPIILFNILICEASDSPPPQLQVLFHQPPPSDPSWPPPGIPGPSWPGHMSQLAIAQPKTRVDVAYDKGFPGPGEFYSKFVDKKQPVVFHHATDSPGYKAMKLEQLNSSTRGAISQVEVRTFLGPELEEISLFNFVNDKMGEAKYVSGPLNKNFKDLLVLPRCLQCSHLLKLLLETSHVLLGHVYPLPVKQNEQEMLTCQVEGSKEVLLVDTRKQPGIESILDIDLPPHGRASLLNSINVDYEKYPEIAKVTEFNIALLGPGDCLYIPAGWLYQFNVLSLDNSMELRWKDSPWVPDSDCSRGLTKRSLTSLSFPWEPNHQAGDPSSDKKRKLVDKLTSLIDRCLSSTQDGLTFTQFQVQFVKNEVVLPELQDWTGECEVRAQELFNTLDLSKDSLLSQEDLRLVATLDKSSLSRLLGRLEDRMADFEDLVIDQRVDFSLSGERPRTRKEMVKQIVGQNKEKDQKTEL